MGNLRNWLLGGLLAVVLVLNSAGVFAETVPATTDTVGVVTQYYYDGQAGPPYYATRLAACEAKVAASGGSFTAPVTVGGDGSCVAFWVPVGYTNIAGYSYPVDACPAGYTRSGSQCTRTICPSSGGWTLSGTTCTRPDCPVGYDRDASGQCVKDCTGKMGQPTANGSYSFPGASSTWQIGGCKVHCKVRVQVYDGGTGAECTYTGASAPPDAENPEPLPPDPEKLPPEDPKDCLGQGMGYISGSNGVTCVPSSEAPPDNRPPSVEEDRGPKEEGTPGPDGKPDPNSPDYRKEDESIKSDGNGNTTRKKTETVPGNTDGNGNFQCPSGFTRVGTSNLCEKTTVTTESTKTFCQENPNAAVCKGTSDSKFSGSCATGFVCTGDEATCASARATWELKCSMEKGDATSDAGKGLVDGNDPLSGTLPNQVDAGSFNLSGLAYTDTGGSCPSDWQFNIMGQTSTVSTAGLCQAGHWLGLIGVALSLLAAAFIIIGGVKN